MVNEVQLGCYRERLEKNGCSLSAVVQFNINEVNFAPLMEQVAGSQVIYALGLSTDTANMVRQMNAAGRGYVDVEGARSGERPVLSGNPSGVVNLKWCELAGDAVRPGAVAPWHLGGLMHLDVYQMRKWVEEHVGETSTGAEELIGDSLGTFLIAVEEGGSTEREKLIETIETMGRKSFCTVDFEFSADSHVSHHPDDVIITTVENGTPITDEYTCGAEWETHYEPGAYKPVLLVRPTYEANKRRHPDVMAVADDAGFGTRCPEGCSIH